MNIIDTGKSTLKKFTEVGIINPCFEKTAFTSRFITKMHSLPPCKGKNHNFITDNNTKKLKAHSKKSSLTTRSDVFFRYL